MGKIEVEKTFRSNSIVVGLLFIITMLLGVIDSVVMIPRLNLSLSEILSNPGSLFVGIFSVFFLAIGIVGIATTLFPVVRKHSEAIAITYVSFRVVECCLLILGAILYLLLLSLSPEQMTNSSLNVPHIVSFLKNASFQLSMMTLGLGSTLLCFSFLKSKVVPKWLALWGIIGYVCLFISAVLDLTGILRTNSLWGGLLYIPGGLWEIAVFPGYLFLRGFNVTSDLPRQN